MAVKQKAQSNRRRRFGIALSKLVISGNKTLDEGLNLSEVSQDDFVLLVLSASADEVVNIQRQSNTPRAVRERLDNLIEECLSRLFVA